MYNIKALFYRSGIWPFDAQKLLNGPRPATAEPNAYIMSVDELYSAFQEKQKALRNSALGSDATITRCVFLDTPSKYKLLRMTRGRCVVTRRCSVDGPLTCVKLYLEYNRITFQLNLH